MAEFNVNDKFDPSKGYDSIRFGSDSVLLETELNELQKIQNHARAEIYRAMVHSGVLDWSNVIYRWHPTATDVPGQVQVPMGGGSSLGTDRINAILLQPSNVLINGHKIKIESPNTKVTNTIVLPEPPTEGTRDDLVFLEAWFEEVDSIKDPTIKDARIGEETSRRTKLNWRIRTVAGVDFNTFTGDGLSVASGYGYVVSNSVATPSGVHPQGGTDAPVSFLQDILGRIRTSFRQTNTSSYTFGGGDVGLFVAGDGSQVSKDLLKTADGYVYAIPLFRVKRRNSGGYSQNNGNGARLYYSFPAFSPNLNAGEERVLTKTSLGDSLFNAISVGDYHFMSTAYNFTVIGKTSDTVTVKSTGTSAIGGTSGLALQTPNRPDGKFANIIHQDDIIDLRHKVSLTGVNYDQLLEENFDKLLRGELRTKEGQKLLKTYHGVPKTPIDTNHVVYASLDGTDTPERGTLDATISSGVFRPSTTGLGKNDGILVHGFNLSDVDIVTVDVWFSKPKPGTNNQYVFQFLEEASYQSGIYRSQGLSGSNSFSVSADGQTAYGVALKEFNHGRIIVNSITKEIKCYVNGKLGRTLTGVEEAVVNLKSVKRALVGSGGWGTGVPTIYKFLGTVSDFSISKVDRGEVFATLPKDFIDGYAVIDKAFNMQRRNLSDAQISQYTTSIAKPKSQVSDRGITVEKGTGTNETIWETGDKIKVKGIAGEIITGVIDTDTALARIIPTTSSNTSELIVDDISKLQVNDTFRFVRFPDGTVNSAERTVTAIDPVTKKVTFSGGISLSTAETWYMVESTTSTSSPIVKFGDGETVKTVVGTWTNLGTNEATFTLGENVNLDTEDVFIEYSLNSPNGQGGIPEVLTEVLEGQYLGQKYVKGAPVLKADFRAKVLASVIENPHVYKANGLTTMSSPSTSADWIERPQTDLDRLKTLDTQLASISHTAVGAISKQLFSFNLIAEVERQFGRIPKATKSEKAQWLRDNVNRIVLNWSGFGSTGSTSIAKFDWWAGSAWVTSNATGTGIHTSNTVSKLTRALGTADNIIKAIQNDGFVHSIAYSEPSDGVTASTISTDYVELEIEFKSPTGYDTLTPAEPFHNGQQKNFFFIRKETKEIEMMFNCDEDYGVVTWGNYVPYQGYASAGTFTHLTTMLKTYATDYNTQKRTNTIGVYPIPFTEILPVVDKLASLELKDVSTTKSAYISRIRPVTAYTALTNSLDYSTIYPGTANSLITTSNLYALKKSLATVFDNMGALIVSIGLALFNGEIIMLVHTKHAKSNAETITGDSIATDKVQMFSLQGKPLMKGV